ncbi:hypothetical protein L195_g042619 [Trifolium pratense]|uniref:Uncharacterized protein n=1 Tax=Trifolium pratense TaxID=57577 RepID=A0A2K3M6W1_TRIPR|nr:hypothetical protein L195_g042619 [Trifolium pratense]
MRIKARNGKCVGGAKGTCKFLSDECGNETETSWQRKSSQSVVIAERQIFHCKGGKVHCVVTHLRHSTPSHCWSLLIFYG